MDIKELLTIWRDANATKNYRKIIFTLEMEGVPINATGDILAEAAIALRSVGRFYESEEFAQRALKLDPKQKIALRIISAYEKDQQRFVNSKNNKEDARYYTARLEYGQFCLDNHEFEKARDFFLQAIASGYEDVEAYLGAGNSFLNLKNYTAAELHFSEGIKKKKSSDLYVGLAASQFHLGRIKVAIELLKISYERQPRHEPTVIDLGGYYHELGMFDKAIALMDELLRHDPNNGRAYYAKAKSLQKINKFEDMLYNAKQSVNIFKNFYDQEKDNFSVSGLASSKSLMGTALLELKQYDCAIEAFSEAIQIDNLNFGHYYNRAIGYTKKAMLNEQDELDVLLQKASSDFDSAYNYSKDTPSHFTIIARKFKVKFEKYSHNMKLYDIALLIDKISDLLKFSDRRVTHFTSLSTAKELVLGDSLFRLSEASFLNDPSEGTELDQFLQLPELSMVSKERLLDRAFLPKVFIGSFVADSGKDDLTLWRMYGKEQMREAEGCAIAMETEKITHHFNNSTFYKTGGFYSEVKEINQLIINEMDDNFVFFRVAYSGDSDSLFFVPGLTPEELKIFNNLMDNLQSKALIFSNEFRDDKNLITEFEDLLNSIRYLFKTSDYRHEQEVRIIIKGGNFEKVVDMSQDPPRVFVETFKVNSLVSKITLGPKVKNADAWAAAFHYHLAKESYMTDISISRLPFR